MSSVVEILTCAKNRISNIENWTRKAQARKNQKSRGSVAASDVQATCWCAWSSIYLCTNLDEERNTPIILLTEAAKLQNYNGVISLNDDMMVSRQHGHKNVMKMFDDAIELAKNRHDNEG